MPSNLHFKPEETESWPIQPDEIVNGFLIVTDWLLDQNQLNFLDLFFDIKNTGDIKPVEIDKK